MGSQKSKGANIGIIKMHSTQVVLVLNIVTGSISLQCYTVSSYMFSTVAISSTVDPEVRIRLVVFKTIGIQVLLYQEDDSVRL